MPSEKLYITNVSLYRNSYGRYDWTLTGTNYNFNINLGESIGRCIDVVYDGKEQKLKIDLEKYITPIKLEQLTKRPILNAISELDI